MTSFLYDTNILIDHLSGIPKATRELQRTSDPAISMITWIEVMTGASSPEEEAVLRSFLLNFECLPVSSAVAERAAVVRRKMRIEMTDAIVLATAEVSGRVLATRNVKDFPGGMRGVKVPYRD